MIRYINSLILIALIFGTHAYPVIAAESANSGSNDSSSSAELKSLLIDSMENLSTYSYSINVSSKINITSKNLMNSSNLTAISRKKGQ